MPISATPSFLGARCTNDGGTPVVVQITSIAIVQTATVFPPAAGTVAITAFGTIAFTACAGCENGAAVITVTDGNGETLDIPVAISCPGLHDVGAISTISDGIIDCVDEEVITLTGAGTFIWRKGTEALLVGLTYLFPGATLIISADTKTVRIKSDGTTSVIPRASTVTYTNQFGDVGTLDFVVACSHAKIGIAPSSVRVCNGIVTFTALGGRPPYSWTPIVSPSGNMPGGGGTTHEFTSTVNQRGSSVVSVIDADGGIASALVIVNCDFDPLYVDPVPEIDCGAAHALVIKGGNPPYLVTNNPSCNGAITILDNEIFIERVSSNICTLGVTDTPIPGKYNGQAFSVPVRWKCTVLKDVSIRAALTQINCSQSVDVYASGGIEPYTFLLLNGQVGKLVKDELNPTHAVYTAPGSFVGNVQLTVADSQIDFGVLASTTIRIDCPNLPLSVDKPRVKVRCGESVEITARGGTGEYEWAAFDCGSLGTIIPNNLTNNRSAFFVAGSSGSGLCEIRVADGQTGVISIPVTVDCSPQDPRIITGGQVFLCGTGIVIKVAGGKAPFSWSSTGCGLLLETAPEFGNEVFLSASPNANGICKIEVIDGNGVTDSVDLHFVCRPQSLIAAASCVGCGGTVQINVAGGITPYSYRIVSDDCGGQCPAGSSVSSTGVFTAGAEEGACHVRVTDAVGTEIRALVVVVCLPVIVLPPLFADYVNAPEVVVDRAKLDIECGGNGLIRVSGGIPPYKWSTKLCQAVGEYEALGIVIPALNTTSAVFQSNGNVAGTCYVLVFDSVGRGKVTEIRVACAQPCNDCLS